MTTRREFLFRGVAGLAAATIQSAWTGLPTARASETISRPWTFGGSNLGNLPVLQGWTTENETEFKILRPSDRIYLYEILDSSGRPQSSRIADQFSFGASPDSVDHLTASGLRLGALYRLRISDDSRVLDEREFMTLDLSKRQARLALLSCMHDRYTWSQGPMWASVQRSNPDLLLFIGDAVYADSDSDSSAKDIWRRYCETRKALDVYRWKRLVPSLSTWDDHDFGLNNADETFANKSDSKRIFQAFYGSLSHDRLHAGPGVSKIAYAFGLRLSLMDDRFYRAPRGTNGSHWGGTQEEFLKAHLQEKNLATLLCNGSQFYGGYLGKESYEGDQPRSFARLQQELGQVDSPVLFCSGDVHFSELMKIEEKALGYRTWELTSSSVHSLTIPGQQDRARNPRRMNATGHHNFMVIDTATDPRSSDLRFLVRCLGADREYFGYEDVLHR